MKSIMTPRGIGIVPAFSPRRPRLWLAGALAALLGGAPATAQPVVLPPGTSQITLSALTGTVFEIQADTTIRVTGQAIRDYTAIGGGADGLAWFITNSGTVEGTGATSMAFNLYTTNTASVITNLAGGFIKGVGTGDAYGAIKFNYSGTLLNQGYIEGGNAGVLYDRSGGYLDNSGTITAATNAIFSQRQGSTVGLFEAFNSGLIDGGANGILLYAPSAHGRIENSGTIQGTGTAGIVELNASAMLEVRNLAGGLITGRAGIIMTNGTVANSGLIDGGVHGILLNTTSVHGWIENSGTIRGTGTGGIVALNASAMLEVRNLAAGLITGRAGIIMTNGTVANSGAITAVGTNVGSEGIWVNGASGSVVISNTGGVITGYYGVRLGAGNTVEVRNTGGGLIAAGPQTTSNHGISTAANLYVLNDASRIESGAGRGISVSGGSGTIRNINGASIAGGQYGIYYSDGAFTVENGTASLISANTNSAIYLINSAVLDLDNSGTIRSGANLGLRLNNASGHVITNRAGGVIKGEAEAGAGGSMSASNVSAGIGTYNTTNAYYTTIANAGLIQGGNHGMWLGNGADITTTGTIRATGAQVAAVYFAATNSSTSTLRLGAGSVLDGDVLSAKAAGNKIILEGAGAEDANFTGDGAAGAGFESLTLDGARWTLGGTVTLTGAAADTLAVRSGTLTLDGTLDMPDAGAGVDIGAGGRLEFGFGDTVFTHTIGGAGDFAYLGSGSLGLGDGNTWTGDTLIKSGTVTGKIGGGALRLEETTATYILDAAATSVSFANVSGSGVLDIQNADVIFSVAAGGAQSFNFAGAIDTAAGADNRLLKSGGGKLVLERSLAALSGGSFIEDGVLRLADVSFINSATLVLGSAAGRGLLEYTGAAPWTTNVTLAGLGGGFSVDAAAGTGTQTLGAITVDGAGAFVKGGDGTLDARNAVLGAGVAGVNVDDGTLIGGANVLLNGDITLGAATSTLVIDHAGADFEYTGAISGSGNLVKTGGGLLELSGGVTYAGDTTIREGALQGKAGTGTLRVESSGTYKVADGVTDFTVAGIEGAGTVDLNQSSLIFDTAAGVTGSFSFSGQLVSNDPGSKLVKTGGGVTMLLSRAAFSGGTEVREGVLRLDDQDDIGNGILLGTATTAGLIEYAGGAAWTKDVTLSGSGGFSVDAAAGTGTQALAITVGGTGAFVKGGSGALDIRGAALGADVRGLSVLDGTLIAGAAALKGDVTLGAAAGTLVVDHAGADFDYTGAISGGGGLIKDGAGLLELSGSVTYTGDTTIRGGTLKGNIGAGALTVGAAATYMVADGVSEFVVAGIQGSGTVNLNAASLIFDTAAGVTGTFSFSGKLTSGDANSRLVKKGAGTTELLSAASLQGGVEVREGALKFADQSFVRAPIVLGTATTAGMIEYTGGAAWAHDLTLAAGGGGGFTVNLAGAGTLALTGAAAINGAGDFVKGGDGVLDITAANITDTASGKTVVLDGVLRAGAAKLKAGGVELAGAGSRLEFYQTADGAYSGLITGAGSLLKTGEALLDLGAAAHAYGDTIVRGGVLTGNTGAGTLTVEASGTYRVAPGAAEFEAAGILGDGTLDLAGADMLLRVAGGGTTQWNFSGRLAGGGRFLKDGAGTLELLSPVALDAGALIRDGVVRLADQGFLRAPVTVGDGATAGLIHYTGSAAWALPLQTAGGGGGFFVDSGETASLAPGTTIAAAAGAPFIKAGAGALDITAATASGAGAVSVRAGSLLAGAASLPAGGADIAAGAMLEIRQAADAGYAGALGGAGGLVKTGAGTLTLTRAMTGALAVTVAEGGLATTGALSSLTVNAGAAFSASGTQAVAALHNDGTVYLNATVNSHNGLIEKADSLAVDAATGAGRVRVRLAEGAARAGPASVVLMTTGADPAAPLPYTDVALAGRAVYGPFDWTAGARDNTVVLEVGALSPEVVAAGGFDASGYLTGKTAVAAISQRLLAGRAAGLEKDFQVWAGGMRREDTLTADLYAGAESVTTVTQAGADWNFNKNAERPLTLGVFYDQAENDMEMPAGRYAAAGAPKVKTTSYGVGAYVSYRTRPLYVDVIVRGSREDFEVDVPYSAVFATKSTSMAASLEAGGVLPGSSALKVEPQAQLVYQRHKIDDAEDGFGRAIMVSTDASIEARAGVRVWREFVLGKRDIVISPWLRGSLVYENTGKGTVTLRGRARGPDGIFDNKFDGSVALLDGGFGLALKHGLRLQAEGAWYHGDRMKGCGGSLGLAYAW
jgi:autotransporter-associated beta strand protein